MTPATLIALASFLSLALLAPATRPTTAPADDGPPPLRFVSFNLRNSHADDGEHDWAHRRPMVRQTLRFYRPDVLGCQEAYKDQVDALAEDLSEYRWVGVGREDGKQNGEYAPDLLQRRAAGTGRKRHVLALADAGRGRQRRLGCGPDAHRHLGALPRQARRRPRVPCRQHAL